MKINYNEIVKDERTFVKVTICMYVLNSFMNLQLSGHTDLKPILGTLEVRLECPLMGYYSISGAISANLPTGGQKKPENSEETHKDTGRTCKTPDSNPSSTQSGVYLLDLIRTSLEPAICMYSSLRKPIEY